MNQKRAIVTGATGFIGSHLAEELVLRGYEVCCLVRKTSNTRWLDKLPVRLITCDFSRVELLADEIKNTDYFFHSAGLIRGGNLDEYLQVNYVLTKNLIELVAKVNKDIKRFVYISSQAAAGPSRSLKPIEENSPPRPISYYGYSKYMGEIAVLRYKGKVKVTIVRPPVVYGERDEGLLDLFRVVSKGVIPALSGRRYISLIYVKDLVDGIIKLAESPVAEGKTYFMSNDEFYVYNEMLDFIARVMGVNARRIRIPAMVFYLSAFVSEVCSVLTGRPPIFTRDKVREMLKEYWIVSNKRAKEEIGFEAKMPIKEGMVRTIRWYKENNLL